MQLRNPGPVQAAPTLDGYAGQLAENVRRLPGVTAYTHWRLGSPGVVDGAELHVGDPELGHIHLDGSVHIPLTAPLASLLVSKEFGQTPYWSNTWITIPVRSSQDVEHAAWLFCLAHARIEGALDTTIRDEIMRHGKPVAPGQNA